MTATTLSKNLNLLLEKHALSPSQLSHISGIDHSKLSRILNGKTKNPKIDSLSPIASYFGITIDQLIGILPLNMDQSYGIVVPIKRRLVPIIEWKHAPFWLDVKDYFTPKQTIDAKSNISAHAYALMVNVHTFEPRFSHGSILIIDPTLHVQNRDYIITTNYDDITIKQVIIENNESFLKSVNTIFEMKKVSNTHYQNFGIITESHMHLLSRV